MPDDDARTRLREAALDLFGRHGVAHTSTRDILRAAGMKNPSAISYHFGSKAELVDDLVKEILNRRGSVLQPQIDLAAREAHPSAEDWAACAVDWSLALVSTERGCLLARLYWEYDGHLRPAALEEFLARSSEAEGRDLPDLPSAMDRSPEYHGVVTEWMMAGKGREPGPEGPTAGPRRRVPTVHIDVCVGIPTGPNSIPSRGGRPGPP
jgi:AcrR family transcriptional regulator